VVDLLLKIGISNACFALGLAVVAMVVARTAKRPHLANLLWLLVLVKLVTPPLVTIPGLAILETSDTPATVESNTPSEPSIAGVNLPEDAQAVEPASSDNAPQISLATTDVVKTESTAAVLARIKQWAPLIWLLGSVTVLVWSLIRVWRFGRLLTVGSQPAPEQLQTEAKRIARRLKLNLKRLPTICTTSANISPMVWWTGGKVRVVIPAALLEQLEPKQLRLVLAHELAHVRRRDYLVRWVEWLACVGFWWNPVVWWTQRNLRATEEICCDAMVISSLNPKPHSYAESILKAVESLIAPAIRPPAMASEINSGGFLERRFKMIVSNSSKQSKSRWLQACVLLCAVIVLPLGAASAQDIEAVWKRLQTSVKNGEISQQQAHIMMGALKGSMYKGEKSAKTDRRPEQPDRKRIDNHMREIWGKLQHAVKEGKMSQEDAHRKMGEIKKKFYTQPKHRPEHHKGKDRPQEHRGKEAAVVHEIGRWVHSVGEDLRKAAESGKITGKQAMMKWQGFKEHQLAPKLKAVVKEGKMSEATAREFWRQVEAGEKRDAAKRAHKPSKDREPHKKGGSAIDHIGHWVGKVGEDLRKAVESGKITEEHAWKAWGEFKHKQLAPKLKATVKDGKMSEKQAWDFWRHIELAEAGEKLKSAVAKKQMSEKDARRKWEEIRKKIFSDARKDQKPKEQKPTDHKPKDRGQEYLMKIRRELGAAVRAGKLSREDAGKKFAAAEKMIKERMAHARKQRGGEHNAPKRPDWENIKKRIEGAVKRGDMTRKQADAKYIEIKKHMARTTHK
jgi:beta-lactamase regulating signal transducer with metallopeptidase domain